MRLRAPDLAWVVLAAAVGVALRLPFVADPLEPDEAGYLLVARQWHVGDNALYGGYWVDRPPLLIAFFKVADLLGGPLAVRLLGCGAVVALVLAAALAGRAVAGSRGARWCALTAALLGSSFALGAQEVDGELIGAPLVMSSCAAALWAVRRPVGASGRLALGALSGVTGVAAILVKQDLADGVVFAAVLLALSWWRESRADEGASVRPLAGFAAGVLAAASGAVTWVTVAGPGVRALYDAMYGFRLAAMEVIAGSEHERPEVRLALLVALAGVSGLPFVLGWALRAESGRLRDRDALSWAFVSMLTVATVGIAAGGSYWPHYLVQLVPAAAVGMAVGLRRNAARGPRKLVGYLLLSAVVAAATGVTAAQVDGGPEAGVVAIGDWLRSSARAPDAAVVTYGRPDILLQADLRDPYPYLWSLPARVRDPDLRKLAGTLAGPAAPTWLVEWDDFDAWRVDDRGLLRDAVRAHYHRAAVVCGHVVYLHDGRPRSLAAPPERCGDV